MIKARRKSPARARQPEPGMLAYNLVVVIAILAGLVAYSSGASVEAGLVRSAVVILVCTVIGYILNIVVWVTNGHGNGTSSTPDRIAPVEARSRPQLDVVAGDDEEEVPAQATS